MGGQSSKVAPSDAELHAEIERLRAQVASQATKIKVLTADNERLATALSQASASTKPDAKQAEETPKDEHHEAPLPPGLAEWQPIAKTEAVKKASAGIKALEAAFLLAPTGEKAEELRAKTQALAATLRQVIDERVREDQIVPRSDGVIAAGAESFTAIYDSVTDMIKSTPRLRA